MYDITICSIFRNGAHYAERYARSVESAFRDFDGRCCAIWLEGDSVDGTYEVLNKLSAQISSDKNKVILVKSDTSMRYAIHAEGDNVLRWMRISSAWNECISMIPESKFTVCVESDLIWNADIVKELCSLISNETQVVYPMLWHLGLPGSFYDTHGFVKDGKNFSRFAPHYEAKESDGRLVKIQTGGGMIVSTYDIQKTGRFGGNDCIMHYPQNVNLFMDTEHSIYHPFDSCSHPEFIKNNESKYPLIKTMDANRMTAWYLESGIV